MKRVLITGANSYIGTSVEKYITEHYPDECVFDTVDMTDDSWREKDFSGYDAVFHVAGIVHKKETNENAELYYKINRDLAVEVATKSKSSGIRQFVFLSSMSVYGKDLGEIVANTVPAPRSNYGKSKLQAESELQKLSDNSFAVAILRPPMVYGHGCKGNYNSLRSFALKLPAFPFVNNRRSMIYIENLCAFVKYTIENKLSGVFYPQNNELSNTSEMVKAIATAHNKKIRLIKGFGWLIKFFGLFVKKIRKAFGSLIYSSEMSKYENFSMPVSLYDSIIFTERDENTTTDN